MKDEKFTMRKVGMIDNTGIYYDILNPENKLVSRVCGEFRTKQLVKALNVLNTQKNEWRSSSIDLLGIYLKTKSFIDYYVKGADEFILGNREMPDGTNRDYWIGVKDALECLRRELYD